MVNRRRKTRIAKQRRSKRLWNFIKDKFGRNQEKELTIDEYDVPVFGVRFRGFPDNDYNPDEEEYNDI